MTLGPCLEEVVLEAGNSIDQREVLEVDNGSDGSFGTVDLDTFGTEGSNKMDIRSARNKRMMMVVDKVEKEVEKRRR